MSTLMTSCTAQAMEPQSQPLFSALLARFRRWYRHHRDLKDARAAFFHTVYLEDRVLDDIGVTREEVLWAASLPLEENAAQALRACATRRRADAARCSKRLEPNTD